MILSAMVTAYYLTTIYRKKSVKAKLISTKTSPVMNELSFISAFLIGLAGSVHCAGMCGGIVGSFSYLLPKNIPHWPYLLSYNLGRITSYTVAGAIAGYLGATISTSAYLSAQLLPLISGVFIVLLACYIGNWWRILVKLEKIGHILWRRISPLSKQFLPIKSAFQAFPYGIIWGWLPCGLVYSALSWSLASGSTAQGAVNMLFFGLGTLPAMLAIGLSGESLLKILRQPKARLLISLFLLSYGLILIVQAVKHW